MLPEIWATVQRLLVICGDDEAAIAPALQILKRLLSHAEITLLKVNGLPTLETLQQGQFEAAILLMPAQSSPYAIAYLCYLAGIPIRLGQSIEFGGSVLSHWIQPPQEPTDSAALHLHLLQAAGFSSELTSELIHPTPKTKLAG